ncbi:MAG: CAP domain-containing protein [Chloroflexota bacterium]|nr:CAP domain-containing protein [Chloroflexota bacterium]
MTRSSSAHWLTAAVTAALLMMLASPSLTRPVVALELPGDPAVGQMLVAEQALLELTNADRVANGLPPLEFDPAALVIARERAQAQLKLAALSHYDESGSLVFARLLQEAALGYSLAGENLARSSVNDGQVADRIEAALMNSPKHRQNILEARFSRAAIGAAIDETGSIAFAEIFRGE